jgi:hypothetical protein
VALEADAHKPLALEPYMNVNASSVKVCVIVQMAIPFAANVPPLEGAMR